jgi:hypothetical protein
LPQEGFCPQVCRTELKKKKKTEIMELIADKDWKKPGWVLGRNRKNRDRIRK